MHASMQFRPQSERVNSLILKELTPVTTQHKTCYQTSPQIDCKLLNLKTNFLTVEADFLDT